ncbi:matrixin family metalloprotease [Pseudarthrobacter sp. DSP2-3-2b1]|uniref:matrixin family metalloprotease n=1 Tax=Pseudarthrobacter sp. DSP2-3-2b1 TaxID=2804661 RepID=UPI003CEB66D6
MNAANNWMYPGWDNPIYMNFVSSNNGSMMDFHLNSSSYFQSSSIIAQTEFYNNGPTGVNQWYSNWDFTEIHINNDQYSSPSFSNDQALGTTIHEMGHSFGLAHWQTNPYSIMCQTGAGRIVQRVQQVDNDAVNILY